MKKKFRKIRTIFDVKKLTLKVRILLFSTTFTKVYTRPKKKLFGSSLAFTLKEGPVRCVRVCNKSWVILLYLPSTHDPGLGFLRLFHLSFSIEKNSNCNANKFAKLL